MKKFPVSLTSLIALTSIGASASLHLADAPQTAISLSSTAAAEFGRWIYSVAPAHPQLLLPLIFVSGVVSAAAIALHHVREDQQLKQIEAQFASVEKSSAPRAKALRPLATASLRAKHA